MMKKEITPKTILKKFQNKVYKKFPDAKTQLNNEGKYYVSDGKGSVVGDELLLPAQSNVVDAWKWAAESVRFTQNINRTHPMKSEMSFSEKKFNRVSRRNRKK
jgi:hypothetical protein